MSDAIVIALIGATATTVTALATLTATLLNGRQGRKLIQTTDKIKENTNGALSTALDRVKELETELRKKR